MIRLNFILSKLPAYTGTKIKLVKNQSLKDIEKSIIDTFNEYKEQYLSIAEFFVSNTVKKTCENIFNFLRQNTVNIQEDETLQTVKSPAAILATGNTTGLDCKHFASFTAGVLWAINYLGLQQIPFSFRFAKYYSLYGNEMNHVFIVVYPGTEKEIWIDCVKEVMFFNDQSKQPDKFKDINIIPMLQKVSGFQNQNIIGTQTFDDIMNLVSSGANVALPGAGSVIQLFTSIFGSHDDPSGYWKAWQSQDQQNGFDPNTSVQWWMMTDGDNPQNEAQNIISYIKTYGMNIFNQSQHIKQATGRFASLTDLLNKLQRAGYVNEAAAFKQAYANASTIPTGTQMPTISTSGTTKTLLYIGGGILVAKLLKLF